MIMKEGYRYLIKECSTDKQPGLNRLFDIDCTYVSKKCYQVRLSSGKLVWKEKKWFTDNDYNPAGHYVVVECLGKSQN